MILTDYVDLIEKGLEIFDYCIVSIRDYKGG